MSSRRASRGALRRVSLWSIALGTVSLPGNAFQLAQWNNSYYYGPDGPWQAVIIDVNYNSTSGPSGNQSLNLYPYAWGGNHHSQTYIPTTQSCSGDSSLTCGIGGTVAWPSTNNGGTVEDSPSDGWGYDMSFNESTVAIGFSGIQINNQSVCVAQPLEFTYPSLKAVNVELGIFWIGGFADPPYASPDSNPDPLGYLYNTSAIKSYSYGMHIGAAALNYTGSLIYGGYDRGRVIGPVVSTGDSYRNNFTLADIEISVETGSSPFSYKSRAGLLQADQTPQLAVGPGGQELNMTADPLIPYIILPQATIDAIVDSGELPVYYDSTSRYYLWNTSSPTYQPIVTSPTYLGFNFTNSDPDIPYVLIKVPFMLLNLTLEPEASGLDAAVPYFPLQPNQPNGINTLGRAFLQAAFIGANYGAGTSWLAQAPGPGEDGSGTGLGFEPVDLRPSDSTPKVRIGKALFNQSWANTWTPLSNTGSGGGLGAQGASPSVQAGKGGGLSGGAIAGIVIAIVLVALLVVAGAFIFFRRKRRSLETATMTQIGADERGVRTHDPPQTELDAVATERHELDEAKQTVEAPMDEKDNDKSPQERWSSSVESAAVELPANETKR